MDKATNHPIQTKYQVIGKSHEDRDIFGLHLSEDFTIPRPVIWLQL